VKSSFIRIAETTALHRKRNILKQESIKIKINYFLPTIV